MEREALLKQLMALDFMALDLSLYLNTHPDDSKAIEKYNETNKAACKIRAAYEKNYGPLCSYRSYSPSKWCWEDDPWPWSSEFNPA